MLRHKMLRCLSLFCDVSLHVALTCQPKPRINRSWQVSSQLAEVRAASRLATSALAILNDYPDSRRRHSELPLQKEVKHTLSISTLPGFCPQLGISTTSACGDRAEHVKLGSRAPDLEHQLKQLQELPDIPRRCGQDVWEVVEFLPDASYKAIKLNLRDARLDPRDVSLFAERKGYNNQQATLVPRPGAILFKTEIARAIIHPDRALVFASRRERETLRLVQGLRIGILGAELDMPFELRVLEALLAETVRQFERHLKRLLLLSESVEREVTHVMKASSGDLTRLLPIQKRMTEMRQDVAETKQTIKQVLETEQLPGLCLAELQERGVEPNDMPRSSESLKEAALLLQSYERQISTIENALREKHDYLEVVREVWGMQLDATRNRIIRIDLIVAIASFAMIMPTVPAAFFGMNTISGYEEASDVFWPIVTGSVSLSALTFLAVYMYWRFYPNSRAQHRINDVRALHDLLSHHIDDLEDIMAALKDSCQEIGGHGMKAKSLDRGDFSRLVRHTLRRREVDDREVDLLYRVFDSNRDGFLSLAEVAWHETKFRHAPVRTQQ